MDTIGPALSHWYHIHSPFTTSLESGLTNQLKSSVCFLLSLSNCNKQGEEGETHTQRWSQTFLLQFSYYRRWLETERGRYFRKLSETDCGVGFCLQCKFVWKRFYSKPQKQTFSFIADMRLNTGLYQVTWETLFQFGAWENNMQLYLRISECFFTHQMSVRACGICLQVYFPFVFIHCFSDLYVFSCVFLTSLRLVAISHLAHCSSA